MKETKNNFYKITPTNEVSLRENLMKPIKAQFMVLMKKILQEKNNIKANE